MAGSQYRLKVHGNSGGNLTTFAAWNDRSSYLLGVMPQYHFNFVGEKSVDGFFIEAFDNDASAKNYASQLAASFRHRMPDICDGSYISLTKEGAEIAKFLLSTTH